MHGDAAVPRRIGGLALADALPAMTAGLVIGVVEVLLAISFGALVFSGPLAAHAPAGISFALIGATVAMLGTGLWSGIAGTVGSVQDAPTALVAVAAAGAAAAVGPDSPTLLPTVLGLIVVSTLGSGVAMLGLGLARLGSLVRLVPYPVVGGFLGGTGWLLLDGGVLFQTGLEIRELGHADAAALVRLLPALGLALVLYVAIRRWRSEQLLPIVVGGGAVVFYAVVALGDGGMQAAAAGGWLLGPFPEGPLWRGWVGTDLGAADWSAVLGQSAAMLTAVVVGVLSLLLNATGIELEARGHADVDHELRIGGATNVAIGAVGGFPGFHALSLTVLARRTAGPARLVSIVASGVVLAVLLAGGALLGRLPRPVLGGLLLYLGLALLVEWLVDGWHRLVRSDYAIVATIVLVIATFGLLEGVAIGIAITIVLSMVSYSRTPVLRSALTGRELRSNVERAPEELDVLRDVGGHVRFVELQGFLFFGTANRLFEQLREVVTDAPELSHLVVDLRRVGTLDSSAIQSLVRIHQTVDDLGAVLVVSGAGPSVRGLLDRSELGESPRVRFEADLDRAAEHIEDELLDRGAVQVDHPGFARALATVLGSEALAERAMAVMEPLDVAAGEVLIRPGDDAATVYLLAEGRLSAVLGDPDEPDLRLGTMRPGTVVGEVGMYLGSTRTASVVADVPSRVHRLEVGTLDRLATVDPELAAALHRMFARHLAERLRDRLATVRALMD